MFTFNSCRLVITILLLGINTNPKPLFKAECLFQQFSADILVRHHIIHHPQIHRLSKLKNRMQSTQYIHIIRLPVTVARDFTSYTFLNLFKLLCILCNYDR